MTLRGVVDSGGEVAVRDRGSTTIPSPRYHNATIGLALASANHRSRRDAGRARAESDAGGDRAVEGEDVPLAPTQVEWRSTTRSRDAARDGGGGRPGGDARDDVVVPGGGREVAARTGTELLARRGSTTACRR